MTLIDLPTFGPESPQGDNGGEQTSKIRDVAEDLNAPWAVGGPLSATYAPGSLSLSFSLSLLPLPFDAPRLAVVPNASDSLPT